MIFTFKHKINKNLGIDIGTHSIKIVELEKDFGGNIILNNYGLLKGERLFQNIPMGQEYFLDYNKDRAKFSTEITVQALKTLIEKTKISCKNVVFAIPDFQTFFHSFTIPVNKDDKELNQMVNFEIQKYIPLPLSELEVTWTIISNPIISTPPEQKSRVEKDNPITTILFAAIPKEIIHQYKEVAEKMNFKLIEMETEIFSLIRALALEANLKNLIVVIEIGVQSTSINIVEKKELKISYSFNISGFEINRLLVSSLNINLKEAEEFKKRYGIIGIPPTREKSNKNIILPLINLILEKYKQVVDNFLKDRQDKIDQIYLSGGTASLPGLAAYFSYILKIPTDILNPLKTLRGVNINKQDNLLLGQTEASYTIALGAALKNLKDFDKQFLKF